MDGIGGCTLREINLVQKWCSCYVKSKTANLADVGSTVMAAETTESRGEGAAERFIKQGPVSVQ